jgi:hypothetical protein
MTACAADIRPRAQAQAMPGMQRRQIRGPPQHRHCGGAAPIAAAAAAPDITTMCRIVLCLVPLLAAPLPILAQTAAPAPPYYAMEPTTPLTPTARSLVQQQILENYRARLQQAQRDLQLQNPAGFSQSQLEVSRQLNAFGPGAIPLAPAAPAPAPGFNPAPFAATSAVPLPPFAAAPPPSAGMPR